MQCYESSKILFYFDDLPELADFNTLHAFGGASKQGYAAAIYLVSEFQDNYSSRLVAAKTRVAPPGKTYNSSFGVACRTNSSAVD